MFTKDSNNPVLDLGAGGTWDDLHVLRPSVIYRNNKWYMYYSGNDGSNVRIGLATSADAVTWTKHAANPILDLGAGGTWDRARVSFPSVIYRNHKCYMYYTAFDAVNYRIGLATSADGITWTKHAANPVLGVGAGGTWDDVDVAHPTVIYRNNQWYMYYSGNDGVNHRIGLATSADGITWTKHAANPVLDKGAGGTWDDVHVYYSAIIYRNNKWCLYYSAYGGSNVRIGLATSADGITWTKHSGNPILDIGAGGTWDDVHVYCPAVIYRNNKRYMYYSGNNGSNLRIGLATGPTEG